MRDEEGTQAGEGMEKMEFSHFDQEGNAVMVDVSEKEITCRTALASGKIRVSSEVFEAIAGKKVKKGDVLTVAQIAGIMGTKKTSELIPMCHLLTGVSAALLTVYDMCKAIDKRMVIEDIHLCEKQGGKSGDFIF